MDGMGATSSTAKCVILSKASNPITCGLPLRPGRHRQGIRGLGGSCGNLSTGAGAFAIHADLVDPSRIPESGTCEVRIWQANIGRIPSSPTCR